MPVFFKTFGIVLPIRPIPCLFRAYKKYEKYDMILNMKKMEYQLENKEERKINPPEEDGQYVYILRCKDNTLYTGWTTNLKKRLHAHNFGEGSNSAKYTRYRRPVELVYYEELESKSEALKREHAIKKLRKEQKEELIKGFALQIQLLYN